MTVTETQDYLQFATLDGKGNYILLNNRLDYKVKMSKSIEVPLIENALIDGCQKHNLDSVNSGNVQKIARELRELWFSRREENSKQTAEQAFELAEALKQEFTFKTMNDTEEIYYYKGGKYVPRGERLIKIECAKIKADVTTRVVTETIQMIGRTTGVDRTEIDANKLIINCNNGLLNLRTGEFKEHNPEYLSVIQIPIAYNKKAKCPKIIHFLYDILQDPSDVPLVLEYFSYCLFRDAWLQKDLMVVGEEDNGKSVLLKLLRSFLGTENVGSKTLHQLTSNRFATADLYGKLANIFADISAKKLEDIEMFKGLGGIDRISAERKCQDPFDYDPTFKLVFSANVPPKPSEEMNDPFFRRWLLVQTQLRTRDYFTGTKIVRDRNLIKKLTTEEELSGLLNLVIVSAKRLFEKSQFCKNPSTEAIRELYERLADPVKQWIDERCELSKDVEGDKDSLHANYIEFCYKHNYRRLATNALGRALAHYGIHDAYRGQKGERRHVWVGITLLEKVEDV
jgi:P4 family phage/plasmid primase-like protien